jgi:hypothetical protein
LRRQISDSELALEEARSIAHNMDDFQKQVASRMGELQALEARAVSGQRIDEFRGELVSLVRQSGCQIRRIQAGSSQTRKWLAKDDPLQSVAGGGGNATEETGFQLESQTFSLSVSGSLPRIKELLAALHARQYLAHTRSFALRPTGPDGKEASLDVELWLFDLVRKKPVSA